MTAVRHFRIAVRLGCAVAYCAVAACVPLSEYSVESAPCPCPTGYRCCNDRCTKTCDESEPAFDSDSRPTDNLSDSASETVATDSTSTDTSTSETEPNDDTSSQEENCGSNQNCFGGEVCLSWRDADGILRGPGICRNTCFSDDDCDVSKVCELTLSDGRPMEEPRLALACLDDAGFDGCAPSSCRECVDILQDQGGEIPDDVSMNLALCNSTFDTLLACFVALDSVCGLVCSVDELSGCDEGCSVTDGVAACDAQRSNPSDGWCTEYPCESCEADVGGTSCGDSQKQACMYVPLTDATCGGTGCACDEICMRKSIGTCP